MKSCHLSKANRRACNAASARRGLCNWLVDRSGVRNAGLRRVRRIDYFAHTCRWASPGPLTSVANGGRTTQIVVECHLLTLRSLAGRGRPRLASAQLAADLDSPAQCANLSSRCSARTTRRRRLPCIRRIPELVACARSKGRKDPSFRCHRLVPGEPERGDFHGCS